ncbi:response regulator transcription factor [Burkholderia multivorans]|uniref:response regulator transcription factor n=1 Tax=Burkholderia multivorans TaxID=87883 RepID=UPI0021BE4237|nr:response regulator transcription factor [Burkholderia multivorans]
MVRLCGGAPISILSGRGNRADPGHAVVPRCAGIDRDPVRNDKIGIGGTVQADELGGHWEDGSSIRVMLADDHPAALLGLRQTLAREAGMTIVGAVRGPEQLLSALGAVDCDVLLSDYAMPGDGRDGLPMFRHIRRHHPSLRIVVHTMIDNPATLRLLMHEGIGCLLGKGDSIAHLVPAIHAAYAGGSYVSPAIAQLIGVAPGPLLGPRHVTAWTEREAQIIALYMSGMSINEIADMMCRTKQTISAQKSSAMAKLGLHSDIDLIKYVIETAAVERRA